MQKSDVAKVQAGVSRIIEKNKFADLFHKTFLRPVEVELKTALTENDPTQADRLPYGLKQVVKRSIFDNHFVHADFEAFEDLPEHQQRDLSYIVNNNYDNLLSLIKPPTGGTLKLAICVCMYSEDKTMLRRTLSGVADNIRTFVRNGYSPDDIAVVFVMDGIEVVDESVLGFFAEMEKENYIYLEEDVEPSRQADFLEDRIDDEVDEDLLNVNHFLFDELEWKDRQQRRLFSRKQEYHYIKMVIKEIQQLERNKKLTYYGLNDECKESFITAAK